MTTLSLPKHCLSCQKRVKGRTDKKFCDDHCRNNYNNQHKNGTTNLIRNINVSLGKNRRILEEFLADKKMVETTHEKLLQKGFLTKYFTHQSRNKTGDTWFFCYDLGYLPLENGHYLVVKQKEE